MKRRIFSEEHNIFREQCKKFADTEIAPHIEEWQENKEVSREVWEKAGAAGFLCPWAEEKYGGAEADLLDEPRVLPGPRSRAAPAST